MKFHFPFSRRAEDSAPYRNMAFGGQGRVGRLVLKPPHKISFPLFPGALRTARPTANGEPRRVEDNAPYLSIAFRMPMGRAACPQAAVKIPSLIPRPIAVMPSIRRFSLLLFKPPGRFFGRAVGTSMEKWNEVIKNLWPWLSWDCKLCFGSVRF